MALEGLRQVGWLSEVSSVLSSIMTGISNRRQKGENGIRSVDSRSFRFVRNGRRTIQQRTHVWPRRSIICFYIAQPNGQFNCSFYVFLCHRSPETFLVQLEKPLVALRDSILSHDIGETEVSSVGRICKIGLLGTIANLELQRNCHMVHERTVMAVRDKKPITPSLLSGPIHSAQVNLQPTPMKGSTSICLRDDEVQRNFNACLFEAPFNNELSPCPSLRTWEHGKMENQSFRPLRWL